MTVDSAWKSVTPLSFTVIFVVSGAGCSGDVDKADLATGAASSPAIDEIADAAGSEAGPPLITNSIGMKLKLIPAGEFVMGSAEDDQARFLEEAKARKEILSVEAVRREGPAHRVRITKPFYLGLYEVTQAEYEQVMGTNPSAVKGATNPVGQVSWVEAVEFCKRLSAKEGKAYRLPTEAEWEYACRAGTTTQYSFGDDPANLGEYAWHAGSPNRTLHPVGERKPNPWGLYDMHGNVKEWCADRAGMDYDSGSLTNDPTGPETGSFRVYRGGSWLSKPSYCRSAYRDADAPDFRDPDLGFRVARSPSGN